MSLVLGSIISRSLILYLHIRCSIVVCKFNFKGGGVLLGSYDRWHNSVSNCCMRVYWVVSS